MPLERFYRLPEEKQRAIRRAAVKEFSRVPIDKVSINKIIKDAEISRGSFYTYFEDKWDILAGVFENWQSQMRVFCMENLEKNHGDIWLMLEDFLGKAMEFCAQNDSFEFIRNVMAHSNSEDMFSCFSPHAENCTREQNALEQWIYENSDKSHLKSRDQESFHRLMTLAMSSLGMAMRDYYQGGLRDSVKKEFEKKLEVIRYGVCSE